MYSGKEVIEWQITWTRVGLFFNYSAHKAITLLLMFRTSLTPASEDLMRWPLRKAGWYGTKL